MATKRKKKESQKNSSNQKKKQSLLKWQIGGVAILLVLGGIGFYYYQESMLPGQKIENLGQQHVSRDYPFTYNSNPPTSGPHAGPVDWGEHSQEILEINQVHNLEHGGILIQYNCEKLPEGQSCGQIRSELRKILKKAREEIDRKIILAPYAKMPHLIATTAWTRLQYFDTIEEDQILAFADSLINQAPEFVK